MPDIATLQYNIVDSLELNLSYMPFVTNGGLFVPTADHYSIGDKVVVELQLPGKKEPLRIEGSVIWLTPKNALHHVACGIGIQFTGANAAAVRSQIESMLDKSVEIGGYTYGITEETRRDK